MTNIDPRLRLLSYSSLLTLHSCPRKYQLYRMKAVDDIDDPTNATNQNLTFAFGHLVGEGAQLALLGKSEDEIIFTLFRNWYADLADYNPKQNKSFYLGIAAVQKLIHMRELGYLDDYEILMYNGKPAIELAFRITFPDGFTLRGSVDAVLRHKVTGKVVVLELKTSSSLNLNPTTFKNSAQGIGYSVVLDVICPDIINYDVLYLVYLTKDMEYEQLQFKKTYAQRATWVQEVLLDIETIKLYESVGVYPTRGESCYSYFHDCEYLHQCGLSTKLITQPIEKVDVDSLDTKVYDVELTLMDLLQAQLSKVKDSEIGSDGSTDINGISDVEFHEHNGELL